jgi:hypothetical protein
MTPDKIAEINADRLDRWTKRLLSSHATALVMVGVGHDHKKGQLVLCTTEDGPSNEELAGFLRWAANQLERRK